MDFASLIGWITAHSATVFYGILAAVIVVAAVSYCRLSRIILPFNLEIVAASKLFMELIEGDRKKMAEFMPFMAACVIAFAIRGGLVMLAVLLLIANLATPRG